MINKQFFSFLLKGIVVFLLMHVGLLFAVENVQYSSISFQHITRNEGLQNSFIRSLYQDRKGFIFIGTEGGLHLYDGSKIRIFIHEQENKNSLPGQEIRAIVEDPDSNFVYWIGTENGLSRFNLLKNTYRNYFVVEDLNKYKKPPGSINCLYVDSYGHLWIGFRFNGLRKYDPTTKRFITFKNDPHDPGSVSENMISRIFEDDQTNLWVITTHGTLNKYDRLSGKFSRYVVNIPEKLVKSLNLRNRNIRAIAKGADDILWLAFHKGLLYRFHLDTGKYELIENAYPQFRLKKNVNINYMLEDHTGTLWLGTTHNGLIQLNFKTKEKYIYTADKHIESDISSNKINVLYEDNAGNLWIGTGNNGVDYFLLPQKGFHNIAFFEDQSRFSELSRVFAIHVDEEQNLWVGFINAGLLKINLKNNNKTYYYDPTGKKYNHIVRRITSIAEDSSGVLWIAMINRGLVLFDKKRNRFFSPVELNPQFKIVTRSPVFKIYIDRDGDVWIGTINRGLFHYDRYKNTLNHYSSTANDTSTISSNHVRSFLQDSKGFMWIGTIMGLDKLDKYSKKVLEHYKYADKTHLEIRRINVIHEDKNNMLWIGTIKGLIKLNPTTKETLVFNKAIGFPSNRIFGILESDPNHLWIGTYKGLIYFNTQHYSFYTYTLKDGLLDDGFNHNAYFKTEEGVMYFGHHRGITYFKPNEIEYGKRIPEIVITDFKSEVNPFFSPQKDEKSFLFVEDSRIEFPYKQRTFYIEFAALDYTNPKLNKYAYKVEGIDNKWRFLGNRNYLSLINIPPGKYPIRIIGASARGIWNEKGILINLVILPPFWQTWWFRSLMGLFVLLVGYLIFYLRTMQVKKRNLELEQINAQLNEQISVRKHVENMLRLSEEKYKKLVNSIEYFIVTCGQDGIITFVNDAFAKALGDKPEKFIGKSLVPYIPDSMRKNFEEMVEQVLNTGVSTEYDVDFEIKSERYYFHVNLQPLKEFDTISRQVLMVVADVTRRRNLEEQLRQSQKMEAIGKLAGGIAHDFNNLIAIIRGYSDIILSDMHEENELYESVLEIDKAGERAAGLVRQLLAFSRRQILQPKVLDVNQLIRDMEKMLNRLIRENVEVWFRLDPDLGNIYADPGQIEQVIMNLVLNARDAIPEGGKISIETKCITAGDPIFKKNKFITAADYVMIEVRDNGVGIKKELRSKIFDPFFTTKEKGQGTGLGLSTVFGIVKQSKGYILLESEEGKGTSFKIFLPKVDEVISSTGRSLRLNKNLRGEETILVVEDEKSLRSMICKMLRANGYKVMEAADGAQALKVSEGYDGEIDLLLTDVVMPGMSGKDLADLITDQRPGIAVLFMSGYTDNEIVHQGVLFPGTYFIQKPFTPESLGKKIRETLKAFKKKKAKP